MAEATKSTAKISKKTSKQTEAGETFSIPVRKAAPVDEQMEEKEEDLKVHHELVLKAPKSLEDEALATNEDTSPEVVENQDEQSKTDTPPPTENTETSGTEEEKTAPLGETSADAPADDMQSPTVFDTKQYHLPINESHASGSRRWVFVLGLLLVALAGVAAIDAGWIDLGFELPFDLIK